MSAAGLLAAALKPELFHSISMTQYLTTLKGLFDWPENYTGQRQSLFCFGLLEVCDLPDLADLLGDVTFIQTGRI